MSAINSESEYRLMMDVFHACEVIPPCGPYDIALSLSQIIPFLPTEREKFVAIGFTAIGQHIQASRISGMAICNTGVPKLAPDIPAAALNKYQVALSNPDQYIHGWPVNFAFYAGIPYLHIKVMGVELVSPDSAFAPQEQLSPFSLPQTDCEVLKQKKIRDVYLMFRNLLSAGMPVYYLKQKLAYGATTTVSAFETIQATMAMALTTVQLAASQECVKKAMAIGAYEALDNFSQLRAEYMHARITAIMKCGRV